MKTGGIKTKITILFGILVVVLVVLFVTMQSFYAHEKRGEFMHKVRISAPTILKTVEQNKLQSYKQNDILLQCDEQTLANIAPFRMMQDGMRPPPPPGHIRDNIQIVPARLNGRDVLMLQRDNLKCAAIDENNNVFLLIWVLFTAIMIAIAAIYWLILKSLLPLKRLKDSLEKFGNGDFRPIENITSTDEVGQIAKAFNNAANQINILIESKDIFLKNAAHELRTPITKGVITTHLLQEGRDKEILLNVFKRLENISESVINLERFSDKDFTLNLEPIMISTLINDALELLFLDNAAIRRDFADMPILADASLMTIVFKNLIDNAYKFSGDKQVVVQTQNGKIIFKNKSIPLNEPIERYFDPFFKETSVRNAKGSGLGLFLAQKIASAHGLKILYKYEDGFVIFMLG